MEKMSSARVAFALLCGLALCCSVMYITADAEDYVNEVIDGHDAGTSVGSTDVLKAGEIYSETPDGRMRLIDYFNNVEKEIGDEVANRKANIAAVRAQMARDFAFNAAARQRLRRSMLHNMAVNARICRRDLNMAMRRTQEKFAKQGWLANTRQRATLARDKKTLAMINADRKDAAHNLRLAVDTWQKATSSWAAATNAKITRMNKHVAANAAQIKENAKKATKDLDNAMADWNHKVAAFSKGEAKKNSQLAAQFAQQDKATRAWADNKVKSLVASTAAQFAKTYAKMAKNRHAIDMALKHAALRFETAMAAEQALQNKRYAETQRNIKAAKEEAKNRVEKAKVGYKVQLLQLQSTVQEQTAKINDRIDQTAGVVRSNAASQAKVNANVAAEMSRMIKLGNDRYKALTKKSVAIQKAINHNQQSVNSKLKEMAADFNAKLGEVRKELAKDRAHAENRLQKSTRAISEALFKAQDKQRKKNAEMEANIRRMRLDAMNNVRNAKKEFLDKIHKLAKKVADNDKKADKKIDDLTGLVKKNAMKSAEGRKLIADTEARNKNELKNAIHSAIVKGEKRAQLVEQRGEKMDADTKWLVQNKLNSEITALRKSTDASVEALRLQSDQARKEQQKEMLYAIRSATNVANDDLKIAIHDAVTKMTAMLKKAAAASKFTPLEKKAFDSEFQASKSDVSRMIRDSLSTLAQTQTCYAAETQGKIKAKDTSPSAYADRMKRQVRETRGHMRAVVTNTIKEISQKEDQAKDVAKKFASPDARMEAEALKFVREQVGKGFRHVHDGFIKNYIKLADSRAAADDALAAATTKLNDALAKQAAIMDSRFSKTVRDLNDARKAATKAVIHLRKDFATQLALVTSDVTRIETHLVNSISVVSGEIISPSANKFRVDRRVSAEINRILDLANSQYSKSPRARGQLKILMDENKSAASDEVHSLAKSLRAKIAHARTRKFRSLLDFSSDLAKTSKALYEAMAAAQKAGKPLLGNAFDSAPFSSAIVMLANAVAAGAKRAQRDMTDITGVVHSVSKASVQDRALIAAQNKMAQNDLNMELTAAIMMGQARGKAVEQRIAEHKKHTKRWLQIELPAAVNSVADSSFAAIQGHRQKIADNYIAFKAYAVTAADKVVDVTAKGQGRYLSSIGDLLQTVGALGPVKPRPSEGLGMGGDKLQGLFNAEEIRVPADKAPINGLVNEYTDACKQVRDRWPMGLGKYLLNRLEISMMGKGVLQVDKVAGKSGNFVYVNAGSLGLSNKLHDFANIAVSMSEYDSSLAKLTSKLTVGPKTKNPAKYFAKPPEWQGN